MLQVFPGDKVRLFGEKDFFEVIGTTYGCDNIGLGLATGKLELSDGRIIPQLSVQVHKFWDVSEEGEPYWTGRGYDDPNDDLLDDPTPEMLADLRTEDELWDSFGPYAGL